MLIKTATGYIKSPYNMGDCRVLEDFLSIYDADNDQYVPYGYIVHDNALYIPNIVIDRFLKPLQETEIVDIPPIRSKKMSKRYMSKVAPRDTLQENVINFLCGDGMFKENKYDHQLGIVIAPGKGKTFTTVYSLTNIGKKALIITHMTKIKEQWINTFTGLFDYKEDSLKELTTKDMDSALNGKDLGYDIYFISHQVINRWIAHQSPVALNRALETLGIGVKVIDEYHLHWRNSLIVDMFTNVDKTFYLTATFGRSDPSELQLFKRITAKVKTYGSEDRAEEEKHTVYHPIVYTTKCPFKRVKAMGNNRGMGMKKWIFADWIHFDDPENTTNKIIFDLVGKCLQDQGKILVTVASIKATEHVCQELLKLYPDYRITTINSTHSAKENEESKKYSRIIVSTIQSSGTGVDIKGLRYVINAEPFSSKLTAEQFLGRLRPYYNEENEQMTTFLFDLVDKSILFSNVYYKSRSKRIVQLVKETIPLEY